MTKLSLRKEREQPLRRPWTVCRGPVELAAFRTGHEALSFLRRLLSAAHH